MEYIEEIFYMCVVYNKFIAVQCVPHILWRHKYMPVKTNGQVLVHIQYYIPSTTRIWLKRMRTMDFGMVGVWLGKIVWPCAQQTMEFFPVLIEMKNLRAILHSLGRMLAACMRGLRV